MERPAARELPRLAVIGLIAVFVALSAAGFWLDRVVVDSEAFAERAVVGLTGEEARSAIGDRLVEPLVESLPLASSLREPAADAVADLLAVPASEEFARRAATEIHRRLVTGEAGPIVAGTLAVRDALEFLRSAPGGVLESVLPDPAVVEAVEVLEDGAVPSASWTRRLAGPIGWLSALGAVALAVAHLWLVRRRGKAAVDVALAIALAGALSFALVDLVRLWVGARQVTPTTEAILLAIFDPLSAPLRGAGIVMIVAGLATAGAIGLVRVRRKGREHRPHRVTG